MKIRECATSVLLLATSFSVQAAEVATQAQGTVNRTGASAVWILANLSYAGMRAQNNPRAGWRLVAFLFGFPGTLLSYFVVVQGSERAYGVDIPTRK